MSSSKIGLVLGRFQPFHKGHLHLIKYALTKTDNIIIAVGSSNKRDSDNPLAYRTRKKMIEKVLVEEGLTHKVIKIVPIPDHPNNDIWVKTLRKRTGGFAIQFGNNAWPNKILQEAGHNVTPVPFLQQEFYQGIFIRELFKADGDWKERVPAYLVDTIQKEFSKKIL